MRNLFFACAAVLLGAIVACGVEPFDPDKVTGPKLDRLMMVIVANPDAQVLAAEKGELDIVSDIARPSDIDRLSVYPKLEMSLARGFHAFFLMMNNDVAPWNNKLVRQAAAEAVDRNNMVRTIYQGYCEPINSWLPPVSPWATAEGTRNIYDPAAAAAKLKAAGYTRGISGRLVGPDAKPLEKIKLLAPLARVAPTTAELAEQIADSLSAVGFDVEVEPMDFGAMIARLDRRDYSLAVLAWTMGRNPTSLYGFYHSSNDIPGGYNISRIHDAALDTALEQLRFAPDKSAAEIASAEAQRLLADLVPSVPIYSRFSVAAITKRWKNVLRTDKITADNGWTLMMAEPTSGPNTLTMALAEEPRTLNPFTASSAYSWQVLGMIYQGLIGTNPFTLEDMPDLAESWSVDTVGTGETRHTVLRFHLKPGLKWNDGSPLTADDCAATIEFLHKNQIPRFFDNVKDVESARAEGDRDLVVTMKKVSYWFLDDIAGMVYMPKKVLDKITDWQNWDPLDESEQFGPYGLVGAGPFKLTEYRRGEYVVMDRNPWFFRLPREEASK